MPTDSKLFTLSFFGSKICVLNLQFFRKPYQNDEKSAGSFHNIVCTCGTTSFALILPLIPNL